MTWDAKDREYFIEPAHDEECPCHEDHEDYEAWAICICDELEEDSRAQSVDWAIQDYRERRR